MSKLTDSGNDASKILVSAEKIYDRLQLIAQQINIDYEGQKLDVVCLANSAMSFTADLVRLIKVPIELHLLTFNSYTTAPQSGEVRITLDIAKPLVGRHVLMLEGMVISGRTPLYLMNLLRQRQPASVELCTIGSKPHELVADLSIKYCMFEFGTEWVAGYGIGHGAEKSSPDLINLTP